MNALNLALHASQYLDPTVDLQKLNAVHILGLANALTRAIADYWTRAPLWVTSPEYQTPQEFTAETDTNVLVLPPGFERIIGEVWISAGTASEDWSELPEGVWSADRASPSESGKPQTYTVASYLTDAGSSTNPTTQEVFMRTDSSRALFFDRIPDVAYKVRLRFAVDSPRLFPHHFSGRATTVGIPIPDNHIITIVVPMAARYLLAHPKARADIRQIAQEEYAAALEAMERVPHTLSGGMRTIGTPLGH